MQPTLLCVRVPVLIASFLLVGAALGWGPLDPPVGPVAPTAKPLAEVEPRIAVNATTTPGTATGLFRITAPGSYYLTGNITGVVGKHGIEIASSGVTLDLCGFEMAGVAGMGAFDGVTAVTVVPGALTNIKIHNGSVRGWGGEGVDLLATNTVGCSVTSVRASGNAGSGIRVGSDSLLTDCASVSNSNVGLFCGVGCTISGCVSSSNGTVGINTSSGCTITATTVHNNSTLGIFTGVSNTINACTAYDNIGTGISTGASSAITDCTVYSNGGAGIQVVTGSSVNRCTVRFNTNDGILASSSCRITDNLSTSNGGGIANTANIHLAGSDNRVEGNNFSAGFNGLLVEAAGNIIIRNTASGNATNWVIAANNIFGPIVDRTAPANAAVNGNAAPSSLGTADANANFTY